MCKELTEQWEIVHGMKNVCKMKTHEVELCYIYCLTLNIFW